MSNERYYERKAAGLCVMCGAAKEDDGRSHCPACLEKLRGQRRARDEYKRRIGVCPYCGKARLCAGEKMCPDCAEKHSKRMREKRAKDKDYYKRQWRSRYHRLKEAGLCVRCGRKNTTGRVLCPRCRAKNKQQDHEKWIETHYPAPEREGRLRTMLFLREAD